MQDNLLCGFRTAESNIEGLTRPSHDKFFSVAQDKENQKDFNNKQTTKIATLYCLFQLKQKSSVATKKPFEQFVTEFIEEMGDEESKVGARGLDAGFSFVVVLLRQMRNIGDGSILEHSFSHFYNILKQVTPGQLIHQSPDNFELDANLNEFRSFLVDTLTGGSANPMVIKLGFKLLF